MEMQHLCTCDGTTYHLVQNKADCECGTSSIPVLVQRTLGAANTCRQYRYATIGLGVACGALLLLLIALGVMYGSAKHACVGAAVL